MELNSIMPTEINFRKKLFASEFSVIFLVTIRNRKCVMKVVRQADDNNLLAVAQ